MADAAGAPDAAAVAAAAAAAALAANSGAKPWYEGADPAIVGHLQSHGWDKKTANEAALEAAKSHLNASKLLGGPADKLLRIPEANDAAGQKAFYEKLGVPADPAKGYDFKAVKFGDGSELDVNFQTWMTKLAADLHLTPTSALQLGQELVKHMDADEANEKASVTAKITGQKTSLEADWGGPDSPKFKANMFVAQTAAQKLGVSKEAVDALQNMDQVGYAGVMEMFRKIGVATGEAAFIGGGPSRTAVMTATEATSRKDELMRDEAWKARYAQGDAVAVQEMTAILTIIAGSQGRRAA